MVKQVCDVIYEHSSERLKWVTGEIEISMIDIPIECVDFSARSYNCLKRAGYETIVQIAESSKDRLKEIEQMGYKSVSEVIEKLESLGFELEEEEIHK